MEATNSAGGFLVPEEWSNKLLALVSNNTVVVQDLDSVKMMTDVQFIPKVTTGTTAYWPAELATITGSDAAFGQITLTAKKIGALCSASSEILEDNNVDVANFLVEQMGMDLGIELDNQLLNGTGTPWFGLRSTASMTNAVDGGGNTNATSAGGTGSTVSSGAISLAVVVKAVTEVLKDNHAQPDVSYWNPRTIGSLMQLTDSTSRPVLNMETYGSPLIRDGTVYTLYGTKVRSTTNLPITVVYGTTAALSACTDGLVGTSKKFGLLGNRRGFIWKTDYTINTDSYIWQTTARYAFATKYPNAYCLIRAITN